MTWQSALWCKTEHQYHHDAKLACFGQRMMRHALVYNHAHNHYNNAMMRPIKHVLSIESVAVMEACKMRQRGVTRTLK